MQICKRLCAAGWMVTLGMQLAWGQTDGWLDQSPQEAKLPGLGLDYGTPTGSPGQETLSFRASGMYAVPSTALSLLSPLRLGGEKKSLLGTSYTQVRLGPMFFLGDADALDTGFNAEVAYGYRILRLLSIELQTGYCRGESGPAELWGVPLFVNGKVSLPLTLLDIYGGLGVGGYYFDVDTGFLSEDDFVFAGQAFLGIGLEVGPVSVSGEVKYILAADADMFGSTFNLEGVALMVSTGFTF